MILRTFAACMILLFASPAHAGWLGAEWGMTPEQIVELTKGEALLKTNKRKDFDDHKVGNIGQFVWDQDQFSTLYYYGKNGLSKVSLEWKKKPKPADCERLVQRLQDRYGQPLIMEDQIILKQVIWHDKVEQNRIRLLVSTGICQLYYERLSEYEEEDLERPGLQVRPPKISGPVVGPVDVIIH